MSTFCGRRRRPQCMVISRDSRDRNRRGGPSDMNGKLMRRVYCQNLAAVSCRQAGRQSGPLSTTYKDKLLRGKSGPWVILVILPNPVFSASSKLPFALKTTCRRRAIRSRDHEGACTKKHREKHCSGKIKTGLNFSYGE